jgi:hypothetical protein
MSDLEQLMRATLIAAALLAASSCAMARELPLLESLYGTTDDDFFFAADAHAYPRSVEEYRRIVPNNYDPMGFCRGAGHVLECLVAMNRMMDRLDTSKPLTQEQIDFANKIREMERGETPGYDPSYDPSTRSIAGQPHD